MLVCFDAFKAHLFIVAERYVSWKQYRNYLFWMQCSDDTNSTIIDVDESSQAGEFVGRWWKGEFVTDTTVIFNKDRQDWTYHILLDRGGDYTQPRAQYVFRVYGKWAAQMLL